MSRLSWLLTRIKNRESISISLLPVSAPITEGGEAQWWPSVRGHEAGKGLGNPGDGSRVGERAAKD